MSDARNPPEPASAAAPRQKSSSTAVSRVLVCVDFSAVTDAVVEQAIVIARAFGAAVRVLHVATPDPDFVAYRPPPASA